MEIFEIHRVSSCKLPLGISERETIEITILYKIVDMCRVIHKTYKRYKPVFWWEQAMCSRTRKRTMTGTRRERET